MNLQSSNLGAYLLGKRGYSALTHGRNDEREAADLNMLAGGELQEQTLNVIHVISTGDGKTYPLIFICFRLISLL